VAADSGSKNRIGGYWSGARFVEGLEREEEIGVEAAQRAIGKLGARKVPSANVPVVFDAEAAGALVELFSECVLGDAIFKRSSYLLDRLGTRVASPLITMVDDPLLRAAPGSRPFDGDGLPSRRNVVVERGELCSFLTDAYSARKLGTKSTGSAEDMTSTGAGTSNFFLKPGQFTPAQVIQSVSRGLFVTNLMGFGFNPVTGDFSRGASGYWIEGGSLAFPVSEVTISLNIDELFKRIDAVANDLDLKSSTSSPTFRVAEMTLAGT
jgi:PmbA protein